MRKIKLYKCPECSKSFKSFGSWENHIETNHPEIKPDGFSYSRYLYFLLTGKVNGKCIICKKETTWNEETSKYNRFCDDPKCKEVYKASFRKRMISKYGKITMMDDPEFARKALSKRRISGEYQFNDGGKIPYVGSYEKDFLQFLEAILDFKSTDIIAPSPHTYKYIYEGKEHYYIPDFFIPNYNLEIEVKQNQSKHPKILAVDKVKEKLKDDVLNSIKDINYLKIVDKQYDNLIQFLLDLKNSIPEKSINVSDDIKTEIAKESIYNSMDSRRKRFEMVMEETEDIEFFNDKYMKTDETDLRILNDVFDSHSYALESLDAYKLPIVEIGRMTKELRSLKEKALLWWKGTKPSKFYKDIKNVFVYGSENEELKVFTIKGINYRILMNRINDLYNTQRLKKVFGINYTEYSKLLFNLKLINKNQMKIDSLVFPSFFCLEMQELFLELGKEFEDNSYLKIARMIYEKSWLSKSDNKKAELLDLSILDIEINKEYELMPHQKKFVEMWDIFKSKLNLKGYILAFDQGLGKTLTATSLSIVKNKKSVYIICPKTVTTNWADELRLYIKKYSNIKKWKKEVGIVGNTDYPITKNTRFIICNNETIPKLYEYIHFKNDDAMLIIDESHNFRNFNGLRVKQLVDFSRHINSSDVLLCSGTPIKAIPSEIVPALMLIDPLMDDDIAKIYNQAFGMNNTLAANIINRRFASILYRKTKKELNLPEKNLHELILPIQYTDPYILENVRQKVNERFKELYEINLEKNEDLKKDYVRYLQKYSSASRAEYNLYMERVVNTANITVELSDKLHDVDKYKIDNFLSKNVFPNIPDQDIKKFKRLHTDFIMMRQSLTGKAIGEIVPPLREQMYISLFIENKEKIIQMINSRTKKTVIFSPYKKVVDYIYQELNKSKIQAVKIVGEIKNRKIVIDNFKKNPNVMVLVATDKTMGVGITLTEANLMFFFGTPWRKSDFDQCCDRIHRIGQTTDVDIYTVLLNETRDNLSSRMNDILKWSDQMFSSMIKETKDSTLESVNGSIIDTRPYDNPVATPVTTEYCPINVENSKFIKDTSVPSISTLTDKYSNSKNNILKINKEKTADMNLIKTKEDAILRVYEIIENIDIIPIMERTEKIVELKNLIVNWGLTIDTSTHRKISKYLKELGNDSILYMPGHIFDYYGSEIRTKSAIIESTNNFTNEDIYPVYILLSHSNTILANIIQKYTNDKYSHAAICFDPSFKEFYSFGRKKSGFGGFVIESPDMDFYKNIPDIPYGIYCVFVTKSQYNLMKEKLSYFINNTNKFKYHFMGLIKIALGLESENATNYFCSGFVADILQAGGMLKKRSYSLYKPQDLTRIYGSYKIDSGYGLSNIDKKKIIENTNIAKNRYIKRLNK